MPLLGADLPPSCRAHLTVPPEGFSPPLQRRCTGSGPQAGLSRCPRHNTFKIFVARCLYFWGEGHPEKTEAEAGRDGEREGGVRG